MAFDWTDEAVERLKVLNHEAKSASEIAWTLNDEYGAELTRNAIIGKLSRLGQQKQRPPAMRQVRPQNPRLRRARDNRRHQLRAELMSTEPLQIEDAPPAGTGMRLLELRHENCRWPYGDPRTPEFLFCGAKRTEHGTLAFCAKHYRRAIQQ